jgi:hypothetical protein
MSSTRTAQMRAHTYTYLNTPTHTLHRVTKVADVSPYSTVEKDVFVAEFATRATRVYQQGASKSGLTKTFNSMLTANIGRVVVVGETSTQITEYDPNKYTGVQGIHVARDANLPHPGENTALAKDFKLARRFQKYHRSRQRLPGCVNRGRAKSARPTRWTMPLSKEPLELLGLLDCLPQLIIAGPPDHSFPKVDFMFA